MGGCGAHEVVVESPDHVTPLAQQSVEQIERVLETVRLRYLDLMRDLRFQSVIIFKNNGERAGTSLPHPHWQIIATPVVPRLLRMKHAVAAEHFDAAGVSLYAEMLDQEVADGRRVVESNDEFVAFVPYAAHLPFETWILPRRRQASYGDLRPEQHRPLAQILRSVLLKLYAGLENPDFNLTIDMAPRGADDKEYFQWHVRVLPRLTTPAGFELGSGMSINSVMPEDAAKFLRDC
jgi:UDPglucose--hexose-1-phosphate uridylyltransferase